MNIDDWLLEILACPNCRSPLRADPEASELVCTNAGCGLAYPVRDDIPVLLVDEARSPQAGWCRRRTAARRVARPGTATVGEPAVLAALGANLGIAVTKFIAF